MEDKRLVIEANVLIERLTAAHGAAYREHDWPRCSRIKGTRGQAVRRWRRRYDAMTDIALGKEMR